MIDKQKRGDYIISFAVMIQSVLVMLQMIMIGLLHMDAESTTIYRVTLTAVPMAVAMMVTIIRKPIRFFLGAGIILSLFLFTMVFFPDNTPYVINQGFRFLLPVVYPSLICLTVVSDFHVVERTLYIISWCVLALVLWYVYGFFSGIAKNVEYNMAFSFACILPFVSFYSHRKVYDLIICFFLFVVLIAIGSRGAALSTGVYVVFDLFQHKSKWRFLIIIAILSIILLLPSMNGWLSSIGIASHTLRLMFEEGVGYDSGRIDIWNYYIEQLLDHPLFGIGLFGDRLTHVYCHNIFLEILLDFGVLLGSFLILYGFVKLALIFKKSDSMKKNIIIKYSCALIIPLLTSSSYLISSEFAIFMGLCYLINRNNKERRMSAI